MPTHSLITDPNIHEPKGVSTALEGMIYVANGAGSGAWKYWPLGKAFYQHSLTGQIITTTPSKLVINGLGPLTRTQNLPREIRSSGNLWDTTNNRITPIRQYDGYALRIDIPVTAETGTPNQLRIQYDVGSGAGAGPIMHETFYPLGKTTPYTISIGTLFEVLTTDILTNGVELFCNTAAGSITCGSPSIYISKISDGLL